MKWTLAAAAAATLLAFPAVAKTTTYECTFPPERSRGHGWIPEIVVVSDDADKGKVTVFDPIIKHFVGSPMEARRADETSGRITFTWTLGTKTNTQSAKMYYRLTYFKNGNPAMIHAQPGGYDNKFSGDGTCKVK